MGTSVFESYDFAGDQIINLIFSTKNPSINIALPTHQAGETRICHRNLGIWFDTKLKLAFLEARKSRSHSELQAALAERISPQKKANAPG